MSDALRYEWVRLRTLRSTWWLLGISLALGVVIGGLIGWASRSADAPDGNEIVAAALTSGSAFSGIPLPAVLIGLVGVFALGHEYRYGTIRSTLLAVPRRQVALAAKVVMVSGWAVLVAIAQMIVGWVAAAAVGQGDFTGIDVGWDPAGRVALGFVVLMLLWGLVGMALAGLFRNVPGAIVVLLVVPLVVETILFGVLVFVSALEPIRGLAAYLPFSAGRRLVSTATMGTDEGLPAGFHELSPLDGGITFAIFAAILFTICAVLFQKRDA
jgi:ABC-2 type transport system permease protein